MDNTKNSNLVRLPGRPSIQEYPITEAEQFMDEPDALAPMLVQPGHGVCFDFDDGSSLTITNRVAEARAENKTSLGKWFLII